jgi:hypothetical protein
VKKHPYLTAAGAAAAGTAICVFGGCEALGLAGAAEGLAGAAEAGTTLFRGVASDSPGFANALEGVANPIGGEATAAEHSAGNTLSNFTSWTSDYDTAFNFATNGETTNGVILTNTFAPGVAVPVAPEIEAWMMESEYLVTGRTSGAGVTLVP